MSDNAVRVLHLSDFHFYEERRWDSDPVTRGLAEAIGELAGAHPPDVVAITGDIANRGRTSDYKEAFRWIEEGLIPALPQGFPRDRILMVPGNHDVDRSAVKATAKATQKELLASKLQDDIAGVLSDRGERSTFLKRHSAYLRFAKPYRHGIGQQNVPWWSGTFDDLHAAKVHFAGMCSTWTS